MNKKIGYWNWWYKGNKKDLQSIGYFLLTVAGIISALLLCYAIVKVNQYIEYAIDTAPKDFTFNPLPIFILIFLSCIILICFVSYRKYRKENPGVIV